MLIFMIMFILCQILFVKSVDADEKKWIFKTALILMFISGLFLETIPSGDYSEWETSSDRILLTQLTGTENYVKRSETGITFRYISETEFGTAKILSQIDEGDNIFIEIVEIDEISQPCMTISEREGEDTFLTMTKRPTQTKYIFYVPTGTVIYENV